MSLARGSRAWLALAGVLLGWSAAARADEDVIVFVDLNRAPAEIREAQRAADQRGQKLVVFPDPASRVWADVGAFKGFLQQLVRKDQHPVALIFSGHSGGKSFFGERGNLSLKEVKQAFQAVPKLPDQSALRDSVRSVYLFGCYTGTFGSVRLWREQFPKAGVLVGFEQSAPSKAQTASSALIGDLVAREQQLTQKRDLKAVEKLFREIQYSNQVSLAVCLNDQYVSQSARLNFQEYTKHCPREVFQSLRVTCKQLYFPYLTCDPGFEDLPTDTHSSVLRDVYNRLRRYEHCEREFMSMALPSPEDVVRLIFFRNVVSNFEMYFRPELEKARAAWARVMARKKGGDGTWKTFPDLTTLNRARFLEFQTALEHEVDRLADAKTPPTGEEARDLAILEQAWRPMENLLRWPSGRCVPFNWVEPARSRQELESVNSDCH